MKRLIICCDGIWNTPQPSRPTNVAHVARGLLPLAPDGVAQIVLYTTGGDQVIDTVIDDSAGAALDNDIQSVYRFLLHNYTAGDEIYFFGFSRGAYVARSCIGLLRNVWLLHKAQEHLLPQAYHIYRTLWGADADNAEQFRQPYCRPLRIKFLGVWDTLGPLGIPTTLLPGANSQRHGLHDTILSNIVDNAYHALAIDQRGAALTPSIWKTRPGRTRTEQCWFAGDHLDIGGGRQHDGLAAITLRWILDKATACGLALDNDYLAQIYGVDAAQTVHNSTIGGLHSRSSEQRAIGVTNHDETLHPSSEQRFLNKFDYHPANLQVFLKRDEQIRLPL